MSLSRNVLSLVASCAVLLAVACGGTAEERLPAPSAPSEVQALATSTASVFCESLGTSISCSGSNNSCRQEGPQSSKVCGGVTCDGVTQWCPPFQDARECY